MTFSKCSLIALLFLVFISQATSAQNRVNGRVLDLQTGQPLAGVNISIPGTTTGTSTDSEGAFTLNIPTSENSIQIRYIGYITKIISVNNSSEFLNILMEPDNISLNEVNVIGFDSQKKLFETAGSIGLITSKDLERTDRVSLQSSLNTIPGVKMDQSNLTDARISIRGDGVRSGFGIRNIKVYVNEIPITEADGFTRIEGLDVATVGRVEVIKGPASSIYGTGTGGVLNFQLEKAPYGKNGIEISGLFGSYGLSRLSSTYRTGSDSFNAAITVGNQVYDGYRDHNHDTRNFFTGSLQFFPSQKQTITLLLTRSRQETHIPGNLTADQVEQDPTQASTSNLAQGAGRFQTWVRLGAAHTYKFSDNLSNTTSLFTSTYDLDHPLAFAYIRQPYQSYGGRTRFVFTPEMNAFPTAITVGAEFLNGKTTGQRFSNNGGQVGAILLDQELDNTQYSVFIQSETDLSEKTSFTAGLSFNKVSYEVTDLLNSSVSGTKDFNGELMPRVAIVHVFNEYLSVRSGVSFGFSPPTTSEIKAADGTVRDDIQAEKGVNFEVGARGNLLNGKLNYDLTLFSFQMQDQLVPQSVGPNNTIYNNAGKTSKNGLELAVSYFWSSNAGFVNSVRPFVSYTYSDFEFKEFVILDASGNVVSDFSGNDVTGISPHVVSTGIDISAKPGLYLNLSYYFNGQAPITDDNSVSNDSYAIMNSKVGYKKALSSYLDLNLSAGINNLLNESYSSHVALNASAFGGGQPAYYNPAPDRNFYSMASLTFNF